VKAVIHLVHADEDPVGPEGGEFSVWVFGAVFVFSFGVVEEGAIDIEVVEAHGVRGGFSGEDGEEKRDFEHSN
jgi:hypothetical protein